MDKDITGLMVYYYEVCKRKLWYFINEIQLEENNSNVILGKLLEENTYTRDEKKINIDGVINIDFIRSKKILHEIKKSNSIEPASLLQVQYYQLSEYFKILDSKEYSSNSINKFEKIIVAISDYDKELGFCATKNSKNFYFI